MDSGAFRNLDPGPIVYWAIFGMFCAGTIGIVTIIFVALWLCHHVQIV